MRLNLIKKLEKLTNTNSFTSNANGVNRVGSIIQKLASDLPLDWRVYKKPGVGNLLVARSRSVIKDYPNILLSGHIDTVHSPDSEFNKLLVKEGLALGPGVSDMKAGLLVMLEVLNKLYELNRLFNITATFVPDEETGSQNFKKELHSIYRRQDYALVFESSHDKLKEKNKINIVTHRKGILIYTIKIKGKPGHSAIIDKKRERISAIQELAHKILEIEKLADYKKGTTLNVGLISGGSTVNTIAGFAEAQFDVRFSSAEEMRRIKREVALLKKRPFLKGAKTTISNVISIPPLYPNKKTEFLIKKVKLISKKSKKNLTLEKRAGGSDANQISQFGVGVLDGFGAIGSGGHTQDERVLISSIESNSRFATDLIINILKKKHS